MKKLILLSLGLFFGLSLMNCTAPEKKSSSNKLPSSPTSFTEFDVMFYNVENLFDTLDLPETADDEFTPLSEKQWNTERYRLKLDHIGQVLGSAIGDDQLPQLIGLCEVENKQVIEDLIATDWLKKGDYGIVHRESPDGRGIDVALLYQKAAFEVLKESFYEVKVPDEERPDTRLLCYVKGVTTTGKDTLHMFINHWPSRYGGQEASEPKRLTVATRARAVVDSILDTNNDAKILLVGDFNDYPDNKSIVDILKAPSKADGNPRSLFNLSGAVAAKGVGTYNYRGEWGILDQAIVSHGLCTSKNKLRTTSFGDPFEIYKPDYVMYHDEQYDDWKPSRTYGGPNYYGGYSDHLAIIVHLEVAE